MSSGGDEGFLQRWAQRKARVQRGVAEPEAVPTQAAPQMVAPPVAASVAESVPAALDPPTAPPPASEPVEAPPPPTMQDVARLTRSSDYSRFVGAGVDRDVSNAAMRKLFSDPAFNVMDGLDTYIDDYGKPDPLPQGMLRQMVQSHLLGLFADEKVEPPAPAADERPDAAAAPIEPVAPPPATPLAQADPRDEDADLQLQPDDGAGCPGLEPGAEPDPRHQH
jgi:hypothetical protein